MSKIKINMLSSADKVDGQGVGSAYIEQVKLVKEGASDLFDVYVNAKPDADILHHHTIDPKNFLRMKRTKGINVAYVHFLPNTLDGSIELPKPVFKVFKKYVTAFYKRADHLIVVNPIFMEELAKYDIPREKMMYIPNYVSKKDFYIKPDDELVKLRKKYEVDENAFVVIGVGQVQTRKGVLDFVKVAEKMPDTTFIWCGGFSFGKITDGYDELKKVVENPPQNVRFLGIIPRSEMNDIYNIANVLFMPSYNELFPMAILEAVNLHKPLVLRNLELYEDILFEKYVSGSDNDCFVKEITQLKNDKQMYQKYADYAGDISDFYSKENVLSIWREFYQKIYNEHNQIDND